MARKVKRIGTSAGSDMITHTSYDYYSQTPGDYSIDNYYLRELQDKIDADWDLQPNRVKIEFETGKLTNVWDLIEVLFTTVKSDKGKPIAEDHIKFVFRDIQEDRFSIGSKFRFNRDFFLNTKQTKDRDIWLVTNMDYTSMTKSVVTTRCNGYLGNIYKDEQGITRYHYEPAILADELTDTSLFYNSVVVSAKARLMVTTQYNDFTAKYHLNQRFILGPTYRNEQGKLTGQVYKIDAISDYYSDSTYDPRNVGLMKIVFEVTEVSPYDDFETRIAYQEDSEMIISDSAVKDVEDILSDDIIYTLKFKKPEVISDKLLSTKVTFVPVVYDSNGKEYPDLAKYIVTDCKLENLPSRVPFSNYVGFEQGYDNETNEYFFTLQRKRLYLNGRLEVTCTIPAEKSPSGEKISLSFDMNVREQEV